MPRHNIYQIINPPDEPGRIPGTPNWKDIEQRLDLQLPDDYKQFILSYGTGLFAGLIRVFNPFDDRTPISLLAQVDRVCESRRNERKIDRSYVPYPVYPEQPGILPWGNDECGNDYFWYTEGSPNSWPTIFGPGSGIDFVRFDRSMVEFLTDAVIGKIDSGRDDIQLLIVGTLIVLLRTTDSSGIFMSSLKLQELVPPLRVAQLGCKQGP